MKRKKIMVGSLLLLYALTTYALSPTEDLKSLLNEVKTMQAGFAQVIYDNRRKPIETSYGVMAIERPGKFRWEVKKPIPQLIIANQHKLWIYDPDLEQVTIRKLGKLANDSPALLLSNVDSELNDHYQVTFKNKKGLEQYTLVPKSTSGMFERIMLVFKGKQINEMELIDHLGHITHISFNGIKINNALAASLFDFKPAKNIDIIDETKK